MSEMDWTTEIDPTAERADRVLLPEGAARFIVNSLKRTRKEFGKFGTINVAELKLLAVPMGDDKSEPAEIQESLGLHADLQWKITEFFTAIGQRNHGAKGKFAPNWAKVDGAAGFCEIAHREVTSKKGTKYKVNSVKKYITEAEANAIPNF